MKDLFYGLLSFLIIIYLVAIMSLDNIKADMNKLRPYSGYIVTDKTDGFFFNQIITLRKDSLSYNFLCDDIIFEKLEVGDTLKLRN